MAAPETASSRVHASLLTAKSPGAIAIVALHGESAALERTIAALCERDRPTAVGGVALRRLADLDEGLVVRLRDDLAWLMPHGGVRIVERLAEALVRCGVAWLDPPGEALDAFPEAADAIEAEMLSRLAEAASPLAIPLLLDQPRRWRERVARKAAAPPFTDADRARWQRLDRLIEPPTVCVIGPPNAGKSTLANTLAGRGVALASPIAGTTRDFVSTRIDLAGLVVEWIDLPGFRDRGDPVADPIEARAVELARAISREADRAKPIWRSAPRPARASRNWFVPFATHSCLRKTSSTRGCGRHFIAAGDRAEREGSGRDARGPPIQASVAARSTERAHRDPQPTELETSTDPRRCTRCRRRASGRSPRSRNRSGGRPPRRRRPCPRCCGASAPSSRPTRGSR